MSYSKILHPRFTLNKKCIPLVFSCVEQNYKFHVCIYLNAILIAQYMKYRSIFEKIKTSFNGAGTVE